jgi:hypothetical protein
MAGITDARKIKTTNWFPNTLSWISGFLDVKLNFWSYSGSYPYRLEYESLCFFLYSFQDSMLYGD